MNRKQKDEKFKKEFANQLAPFYERAKAARELGKLADTLGVDAAMVGRYIRIGPLPEIGTIAAAAAEFNLRFVYGGVSIVKETARKKGEAESRAVVDLQMHLPFELRLPSHPAVAMKMGPERDGTIPIAVTVKYRGT